LGSSAKPVAKGEAVLKVTPKMAGLSLGAVGALVILWFCYTSGDTIFRLLALLGAALGWLTAILISPLSAAEERQFSSLGKVISGFVTGYLLSKVDPLITALLAIDPRTGLPPIASEPAALRALIALCSYFIALLLVFCARAYWSSRRSRRRLGPHRRSRLGSGSRGGADPKPPGRKLAGRLSREAFPEAEEAQAPFKTPVTA
jgi:hypothetical protein